MPKGQKLYALPWRAVRQPFLRWVLRLTHPWIERALGLRRLNAFYERALDRTSEATFPARILAEMGVGTQTSAEDFERIPTEGSLLVVANHPFGAMEGLALLELIRRRRSDVKIMANYILGRIPELRDDFFFVDPFGRRSSVSRNINTLRQALNWLRDGKVLIVFPAGEVASFAPHAFRVRDPAWQPSLMALARRANVKRFLPVYIPGTASLLFHLVGKIHPRLRTILLPREMLRLRRRTLTLRVGSPLSGETLFRRFPEDVDALRYLRFRTFLLAGRVDASRFERQMRRLTLDDTTRENVPVIPPVPPDDLAAELRSLPPEAHLCAVDAYDIYAAQGRDIPVTLREIGRLREITFRAAGEGTGRDLDTDDFDDAYHQIILWQRDKREIVGCYRLALSDVITETAGLTALYTRTLFRFDERLLGHLPGAAVELGRSFVRPEYQRAFAPLLLLWRGVLAFLAKHPRYTVLFGPVSISHDFRAASRDILLAYLRARCFDRGLAKWVSPRLPPKRQHFVEWRSPEYADFIASETDVNDALAEIEEGRREMPVLIRQYLKLGGKIIAFNVDPDFGTVVDGLIILNLLDAPKRDIARYMGKELYEAYVNAARKG